MRDIKFRAWNKSWEEYEYGCYDVTPTDDYEFEQYTGLKDKNGKEIYEGDIVNGEKGLSEICLIGSGWALYPINYDNNNLYPWLASSAPFIKVVGNIHENPELLEDKHEHKR